MNGNYFIAFAALLLCGCSVFNSNTPEVASSQSQEAVQLTAAQNQRIVDDAVLALVGRYPPAKTTLRYQPSAGLFGQTLEQTLRQAGFALATPDKQPEGQPVNTLAIPDLHTTLDQIQGWPMYRLTMKAGTWQMNKAYRLDSNGQLHASGVTIQDKSQQAYVQPQTVVSSLPVKPSGQAAKRMPEPLPAKRVAAAVPDKPKPQLKRLAKPARQPAKSAVTRQQQPLRATVQKPKPQPKRVASPAIDSHTQALIRKQARQQSVKPVRLAAPAVQAVAFKPPVQPPEPVSAIPPPQPPAIPENAVKVDVQQLLNPGHVPHRKEKKLTQPVNPSSGVPQLPLPRFDGPAVAAAPASVHQFAYVQVMAGMNQADLKKHQQKLQRQGHETRLQPLKRLTALRVVTSPAEARELRRKLRKQGYRAAYIIRGG